MQNKTIQPTSLFGSPTVKVQNTSLVAQEPTVVHGRPVSSSLQEMFSAEENLILYGSDRQKQLGQALDGLLAEITKGSSPVLFELFSKLKKGIDGANVGELEDSIRKSLSRSWLHGILDALKLSSAAKRIESANEKIGSILTSKSKSLLELTQQMEADLNKEVVKLIQDSKVMKTLADEYRKDVAEFKVLVENGHKLLGEAKAELEEKKKKAESGDSLLIEDAKLFEQKISLFENRVLVLETVEKSAPAELEAIRLSQGASYSTIAEVASSSLSEFNSIKSTLIKLAVSHQIKGVQAINDERRKLRDTLQNHGTNTLGEIAVNAAKAAGQNRLDDAQKLLDFATNINSISAKVIEEGKQNEVRFAQAREKLSQVKKLIEQ
jgi:hypothetical protein